VIFVHTFSQFSPLWLGDVRLMNIELDELQKHIGYI